jgi:hypothetical protein
MNFLQLLLQLLMRGQQQNQNPAAQGGRGMFPQYRQGYTRTGQPLNGMGRFGPMANSEGTPQAQAARQWLMNNYWGTPGGGNNSIPTPTGGGQYDIKFGPASGGAKGMGQGPDPFGYRGVDPNAQLNRMDDLFSGEGRQPGAAGFGPGSGLGFPEAV